jgi:hypothetical protein
VIYSLVRVISEIIELSFDNMFHIMKRKGHGALEGFSDDLRMKDIFKYAKVPQGQINAILC